MIGKTMYISAKVTPSMYESIKHFANEIGISSSEITREAISAYCQDAADYLLSKKLMNSSRINDISRIIIPGVDSPYTLHMHSKAFSDLKNIGDKFYYDVLDYFKSCLSNKNIPITSKAKRLHFGNVELLVFNVNLIRVVCLIEGMSITILFADDNRKG